MLEPAVALTVSCDIARARFADRQRRRSPNFSAVLVAHIDHLARRIAHGIVRPRGEVVLLAVERPCVAAAIDRNVEAEASVADDVDPGRGRRLAVLEDGDVFASAVGEAADAVEKLKRKSRPSGLRHDL